MQSLWCWRCQMELPMLDEDEWQLVHRAQREGMPLVGAERMRRHASVVQPLRLDPGFEGFRPFLEMYRVITGFDETNPNAVWHHRIAQYGAPCPECGKPLRTPEARYCVACGHGREKVRPGS